ncbi:hypothetical protein [uncultured Maricaulis sp.]|uniref:hypothetical protein n=1 Tax=uncultured Maricaulis sp. TaxID=174710 RepID=UPI0030DC2F6E|tara:strand:+ start:202173 stop:202484 length:312 start_codon:yes stop_codon:yes gene_type:complete
MTSINPTPKAFWQTPWRLALWGCAAALLMLPALAMRVTDQVTDQVNWTLGDFAVFGAMLAGLVGGIEFLAASRLGLRAKMIGVAVVIAVFTLIWVELAVGIFD